MSKCFLMTTLLAAACTAQAQAVLDARLSNVFGNFAVGAGPVLDDGGFNEFLTSKDSAYARQADDAGAVSGVFQGQPVAGSASFASRTAYMFDGSQITADGAAATTGTTPYAYVGLAANAISSVRLDFHVPVLTHYRLTGSVLAEPGPDVGASTSTAVASVQFTAPGSSLWRTDSFLGSFEASGTLQPDSTYRLTGQASSRINGLAQYGFTLVLSPVPEPTSRALLLLGASMLLWRRRTRR